MRGKQGTYMIVTRYNHVTRLLELNKFNAKRVANFKYLGVNINENSDSYEEIRQTGSYK